jgi:hypothetical protein
MLPVGIIIAKYADEAGKQIVKLIGEAAFLAKGKAA